MSQYTNWKIHTDDLNIFWLGLDVNNVTANVLSSNVLDELSQILQDIGQHDSLAGLVIYSCKDKGFIAGADVNEFSKFNEPKDVQSFINRGQSVFAKLEALSITKVAMIHGFCMGGGLELALACDYRIASDDKTTKIGLPEVLLGIHPGWGGSVRLPKLIGGFNALSQVILTGRGHSARRAKQLGFINDVVPLRQLKRAAIYFIENKPAKHKASFLQSATNWRWSRQILANILRKFVAKKASREHYPAPYAAIDLWEHAGKNNARAYQKEAESVENLITINPTAKNLTRIFLIRERIKAFAKQSKTSIKNVHVIGAGVMGGDIAAWCALRGFNVTLQDQTFDQIAPAIGRAHKLYKRKLRKPRSIQAAMDKLMPDPTGNGIKNADVIIEAVFENVEVKQQIIKNIEKNAKSSAIIATNTSSIPLDEINKVMRKPERLVGIHFFNPVAQMELVEIVSSDKTSEQVRQMASSFVGQIDKMPLPVKSSPGFLINRVLTPYLLAAMQLVEEGNSPEAVDKAAQRFGMVMGPVELADTVGMDICLAVADNLSQHLGYSVPEKLRNMVADGKLGRKSGSGFYKYKNGKPQKNKLKDAGNLDELAKRLIQPMLDESDKCLEEQVVLDADLLDGGMVFATGFAPFRGGPMHYKDNMRDSKD